MFRKLKFGIAMILILMIVTSCSENEGSEGFNTNTELENQITLTPVDLFDGEGAKFKPFLGSMSGAFKLSYTGEKPHVILNIDKWENGEKTSYGAVEDLFFSVKGNKQHTETEVIIAVETINLGEEEPEYDVIKVGTIDENGTSLNTIRTVRDKPLKLKSTMDYAEPRTFSTEESIHVWGIQATSADGLRTAGPSQEHIEDLEWGLVFTLDFK